MPRRPKATSRWLTAATWPIGVVLTSWDYMWRSTPLHRREVLEAQSERHLPPPYPEGIEPDEVQGVQDGWGPLFHRRYRARIREAQLTPEELMTRLSADLNQAAPIQFARFQKVLGDPSAMAVGDEYVVRMPGPWDGPVRAIALDPRSFRLATLDGHLEAGQIQFSARLQDEFLVFEIESWARSGDRLSNLLYHHVRMSKEVQLHMWISFLEGVASLAGGRITGGMDIDTRRVERLEPSIDKRMIGTPRIARKLSDLAGRRLNFDPAELPGATTEQGWIIEDCSQPLAREAPGMPEPDGPWDLAQRLMRSYEFADPSIVRAFYDPECPLEGRDMLLQLRALGIVRIYVGVRVDRVYDELRESGGRQARVWGWDYRTLEGHVEQGQMDWEVWKWLDSGEVEFHIRAISRPARIANPIVRIGFWLLRRHERRLFLASTMRRMRGFIDVGGDGDQRRRRIREAGPELTARRGAGTDAAHEQLARNAVDGQPHTMRSG